MIERKEIFNEKQKEFIEKACQIQIDNLAELAAKDIGLVKEKLINLHEDDDTSNVEIRVQIIENINLYKAIQKDPNSLFNHNPTQITFIANILAEFFDDEWAKEDAHDFIGLVNEIIKYDINNSLDLN